MRSFPNHRVRPDHSIYGGRFELNLQQAIDEFLHYVKIEKNCSPNTYRSYAFDLHVFHQFVRGIYTQDDVSVLTTSTVRRFIQEQVILKKIKPRTLQRRIPA